ALSSGCHADTKAAGARSFSQVVVKVNYVVPTVGISEYTLVTDNLEADRKDAEAIMLRKKDMPLAVQKHDARLFDSWLGRDFIAHGEQEFLRRDEYIRD